MNFTVFSGKKNISDKEILKLKGCTITDNAFISTSLLKAEEKGRNTI